MRWAVQSLDVPFASCVTLSAHARRKVKKSIQQPANLGQTQRYSLNAPRVFAAAAFINVSSVPQNDVMMYTPNNARDAQMLQYPTLIRCLGPAFHAQNREANAVSRNHHQSA
jgi:hypothetical protein